MARRYLRQYGLVILATLGVTLAINLIINPFDFYSGIAITGVNIEKTQVTRYTRMTKAHAVRMVKPQGLILGTSRAEYGLNPQHTGWADNTAPVYNLGLSNGRIDEIVAYLKHAAAQAPLKKVVFAADLFSFDVNNRSAPGFDMRRLSDPSRLTFPSGWIRDLATSLLSLDALRASWKTIKTQGQGAATLYRQDGMRRDEGAWQRIHAMGGHRAAFKADIRYSLRAADAWPLFALEADGNERFPTLNAFRQLVHYCLNNDIELRVLISPIHASRLMLLRELGYWDAFEYWKLRLTQIIEEENKIARAAWPAQLWDFAGFSVITTEPVPPEGDRDTQMRWYWEATHYRQEAGNIILDCIFTAQKSPCESYGSRLTAQNIQAHIAQIRDAAETYSREQPHYLAELRSLIEETRAEREGLRQRHGWAGPTADVSIFVSRTP